MPGTETAYLCLPGQPEPEIVRGFDNELSGEAMLPGFACNSKSCGKHFVATMFSTYSNTSSYPLPIRLTRTPVAILNFIVPLVTFFGLVGLGYSPLLSAGIALVLCVVSARLVHTGVEIDPVKKIQRTYYTALGRSVGTWKPLPPVTGVTLKYFSSRSRKADTWGVWNEGDQRNEKLILLLSVAGSRTGITLQSFFTSSLPEAHQFAQEMADKLEVPLHVYLPPHLTL